MIIVACKLGLFFPAVHSLKQKRQLLKRIIAQLQSRFSGAIAEVGMQDLWQRSEIAFCLVGTDASQLQALADKAVSFVEGLHLADVLSHEKEVVRL